MSEDDRSRAASDLHRLRRRLYAPDATDADRTRYAQELARAGRPAAEPQRSSAEVDPIPTARRGLGPIAVASGASLLLGLAIGAFAVPHATSPSSAQASLTPSPSVTQEATTLQVTPRPIVGAALGSDADRRADRRALAAALRLSGVAARQAAVTTVGTRSSAPGEDDWGARTGCTEWNGQRGFSSNGLRSAIGSDGGTSLATGTRFRLQVYMAGSSDWTWVAGGWTDSSAVSAVALGAGSRASGSSQYAEFTAVAPTTITSLDIRTEPTTPFVWEVDYCTPG